MLSLISTASVTNSQIDYMIITVADLPVEWQDEFSDYVKAFSADAAEKAVIRIRFEKTMPECHGIQYSEYASERILRLENGEFACANADWSEVTSYFTAPSGEYALPLAAICSKFSYYGAFLMHASCVNLDGEGVIFTGFSGIGKTTQAELWQKYLGAEIINGDKAFVRMIDGEFYGCGLPWKGSSEYCLNRKTKLKGIVVLRQANENKITKLDTAKATEYFMPHIFMPHWDKACLDNTFATLEKLLGEVPVVLLECRPDEAAVKLTYNTLFK